MAPVVKLAFSRDDKLLASGSEDDSVRIWQVANGRPLATLQAHTGAVMSVAFRADGSLIIAGSLEGTIRLWGIAP